MIAIAQHLGLRPSRGGLARLAFNALYPFATFAVILALWQFAVGYFEVPHYFIPPPTSIAQAMIRGWSIYIPHLGVTLYSTLLAFSIALILGVSFGILVSEVPILRRTLLPVLIAMQSMPRIALAPIIIVWFGFGIASKVALGAFTAFFPIFLNTLHGMKAGDAEQFALMRSLRASRLQTLLRIKIPNALPFLLAGANIGIIFSMLAVIVGEFLGANQGMGYLIVNQSSQMDTAAVLATVFILSAVGVIFHYALQIIRTKLLFWADTGEIGGASV